jgi:hypothetical protein
MPQINPYQTNLLQALFFRTFALVAQAPVIADAASVVATNPIAPDSFIRQTAAKPINNVMVIDDFDTDFDPSQAVFNHGERVEASLLNRNPNLSITRVNTPSDDNILDVVKQTTDDLVLAARTGQPLPDAINLSIYSFSDNADTVAIRENLRTLARAGVKVGIIAGKEVGSNGRPQLGGTPRQNNLAPFGEPGVVIADATGERIPGATHTGVGRETSFGLPDALGQLSTQTAGTRADVPLPTGQVSSPVVTGTIGQNTFTFTDQLNNWLQQLLIGGFAATPQAQLNPQATVAPY